MSLKSCIYYKEAGQIPPVEFLDAVLKKYPTAISLMYAKGDGRLSAFAGVEKPSTEDILGILGDEKEPLQDKGVLFWSCSTEAGLSETDIQPIECLKDGEGMTHIIAVAEGDFTHLDKPEMTKSSAVRAIEDIVIPKITEVFERDEVTLENILTEVAKDIDRAALFGGKRGCITLLDSLGTVTTIAEGNNTYIAGEWGWSSDHCGYGQTTAVAAKPNKFAAAKAKLAGGVAAPSTPAAPATPTTPAKPSVPIVPAKPEEKPDTQPMVWVKPSSLVQGNQAKKDWYKEIYGVTTDEELEKILSITGKVLFSQPIKIPQTRLPDLKKMATAKNYLVVIPSGSSGSKTDVKDAASPVSVPVATASQKSAVAKIFAHGIGKAVLDHASQKRHTLEQIQALSKEYETWWKQLKDETKWQLEDSFGWPYELFLEIGKASMENLAILAFNLSCQATLLNARVDQLQVKYEPKPPTKADGTVDKQAATAGIRANKFKLAAQRSADQKAAANG